MEASLIQGHIKASRLLALVNKGTTNALVILLASRNPPQVYSDLTIERVIPIDQNFKCDIGNSIMCKHSLQEGNSYFIWLTETATEQQDGLDVHLSVSSTKLRLVFEMRTGIGTGAIVSEIFRAIEGDDSQFVFNLNHSKILLFFCENTTCYLFLAVHYSVDIVLEK